ncbi:MAG: DoxX family protein [Longimicrobiales bacterium]
MRDIAHGLLRIVAGFTFWQHGAQKLLGWFGGFGPDGGTAELASRFGVAGVLEFFGGILIVLGLLTRPVAFILAGEMAVAYFTAHLPRGFWQMQNGGEPPTLYAFIFLFLAAAGAGALSLDRLLSSRRKD